MSDLDEVLEKRLRALEEEKRAVQHFQAQRDLEIDQEWEELSERLRQSFNSVKPYIGWNKLTFRAPRRDRFVEFSLFKRDETGAEVLVAYAVISLDVERRYTSTQLRWKFSTNRSHDLGYMIKKEGNWMVQTLNPKAIEMDQLIADAFTPHLLGLTRSTRIFADFWNWLLHV